MWFGICNALNFQNIERIQQICGARDISGGTKTVVSEEGHGKRYLDSRISIRIMWNSEHENWCEKKPVNCALKHVNSNTMKRKFISSCVM